MPNAVRQFVKLARPTQWAKNVFVLLGPLYGMRDHPPDRQMALSALIAVGVFSLASSAVYVVNDILDAEKDRNHPRKCRRPIASGAITPQAGWVYSAVLAVLAAALVLLLPAGVRAGVMAVTGLYVLNVCAYSVRLKHIVVMDVLSLSLGFVLRVVGGCVAVAIAPSTWLLNVTFFLAMFLAFGKRLGERRTLGEAAGSARGVQQVYTDEILRMFVVVTAVATLITYAFYVQSRDAMSQVRLADLPWRVNVLWLTMLPATYAMARAIVLLERGTFDDPTEMAMHDRPTQLAALLFLAISVGTVVLSSGVVTPGG